MISGHLGDVGILAETATKIAAHRGNGIRQGVGQKMKQGLFFNGINVSGYEIPVNKGFKGAAPVLTHRAYSPAAILDHTAMTAKVAFDLIVLQRLPKISFHGSSMVGFAGWPVCPFAGFLVSPLVCGFERKDWISPYHQADRRTGQRVNRPT
jgi:hypothetical protein